MFQLAQGSPNHQGSGQRIQKLDMLQPAQKTPQGIISSVHDSAKFKNKLMGIHGLFLTCRERK
jgi:hypothetical protein